eukprot:6187425-Pleurochrysis_carterae.AAC.2
MPHSPHLHDSLPTSPRLRLCHTFGSVPTTRPLNLVNPDRSRRAGALAARRSDRPTPPGRDLRVRARAR